MGSFCDFVPDDPSCAAPEPVEPVEPEPVEPVDPVEPKPEEGDDGEMAEGDYKSRDAMMGNLAFLSIAVG